MVVVGMTILKIEGNKAMKKIVAALLLIFAFTFAVPNVFCKEASNVVTTKSTDVRYTTEHVIVTPDKMYDTIRSLERQGWIFREGRYNRETGLWDLTFDKPVTSQKSAVAYKSNEDFKLPDGTYHWYESRGKNKEYRIRVDAVYKDGKCISKKSKILQSKNGVYEE